jgi:hypothetical protein
MKFSKCQTLKHSRFAENHILQKMMGTKSIGHTSRHQQTDILGGNVKLYFKFSSHSQHATCTFFTYISIFALCRVDAHPLVLVQDGMRVLWLRLRLSPLVKLRVRVRRAVSPLPAHAQARRVRTRVTRVRPPEAKPRGQHT